MQTLHLAWNDVCATLLYHRADAVVTRLPFPTDQLHLGHCLAGKESVTLDDIADGPLPRVQRSDPAWSAFWRIAPDLTDTRHPTAPSSTPSRTSSNSSPQAKPWPTLPTPVQEVSVPT
ncbi:hypothetical protein [Streptomyces decoyicus]|uniref:hypothetical protein n=1 Tax=Streptomyces decoyicus TaxID=249567 RepID=UPI00363AC4F3